MTERYSVTRRLEFDAAHRVLRHESKCASLHGHRYRVEITCSAPALDRAGRVVDFGFLKELVGGWIDAVLDHTTLVNADDGALLAFCNTEHRQGKREPFVLPGEPTAENLARVIFERAKSILGEAPAEQVPPGVTVDCVRLYETPNCWADWVGDRRG